MANGIYLDVNSADNFAQMAENRGKMHKIKVWTEWTMVIEIIAALYLMFASFMGFFAAPAGILYCFLLNKKDPKICRRGTLVHIALMIAVVISAIVYLIMAFTMDTPSPAFLPGGLYSLFTSVPSEELTNTDGYAEIMKLLTGSLKFVTSVNLICSVIVTAAPVWMNYKEYEYCQMNEELKKCIGYPYFHPDIALQKATEEIAEKKEHKIQTDTSSALKNARLMNTLRDRNVDFTDTDALFSAITENARPENKTSSESRREALEKVDAMFASARSSNQYTTSAMNTLTGALGSSVMKTAELFGVRKKTQIMKTAELFGVRKKTPNARAMDELVKEAERLRAQKKSGAAQDTAFSDERKISTWGDLPDKPENIKDLSEL